LARLCVVPLVGAGGRGGAEAVSVDARSRLICAGWVPHDRVFVGSVPRV
jgi:hypothetical protein